MSPLARWGVVRLSLAFAAGILGCAVQAPVVETHVLEIEPPALRRIAVAPFVAAPELEADPAAAALVTRFVTEAFAARGFAMIAAGDLATAFEAQGDVLPEGEPVRLAERASAEFGATALLVGRVTRYRERQGGELGATRPASVGFTIALYAAPAAVELWRARFDKTQPALSENILEARRYPGGGSRWLSAAQLARWGADRAALRLRELE